MPCYGHFRKDDAKCAKCELCEYCRDAGDPPLSGNVSYDRVLNIEEAITTGDVSPVSRVEFSSGHWMALIRRILEIDDKRIRTILRLKIEDPNISLSQIGKHFGVTKQMVNKEISSACRQMPELTVVLRNRPMYNRWRGTAGSAPGKLTKHFVFK